MSTVTVASAQLTPPRVSNESPAAGKRVRVTAPEYADTDVYHTLYLPSDWTPDDQYPVIVEYAPNPWGDISDGSVEDTQLGFYQSGGERFIWVTMPFIDTAADPPQNARGWWGNGPNGHQAAADYTRTNLIRILEDFGGDPASVFLTGFSRGAIAAGQIALLDDDIADLWLGMLPHSHHETNPRLLGRLAGRASFVTYGDRTLDGGAPSSMNGASVLRQLGFPVEEHELPGVAHTDEWIQDDASESSLAVRQALRDWLAETIAERPGTSSVLGRVTDAAGNPLWGVRIQSGGSHWTFTDREGAFVLPGLIDGQRALTASHPGFEFVNPTRQISLAGADLPSQDFEAIGVIPEPSTLLLGATAVFVLSRFFPARRRDRGSPEKGDRYI